MRAFACFVGLILIGFAAIAGLTYPAWLLLHPAFHFPFHRIGDRIGMLALAIGFLLVAGRLRLSDRVSLGYGVPRREFLREMSIGLALGIATMTAVVAVMTALGLLDWTQATQITGAAVIKLVLLRLLSGLAVGFIEETFLRGAMLTAIERESGARAAVLLTAIVYSATHFFASFKIPPDRVGAWSGIELLAGTLHSFAQPLGIADAFLCLLAVGLVLGIIRLTTGNIAACIGLHAGWVWVMLVVHELSQPLRTARLAFLLSSFDGFVGWLVLAWTMLIGLGLRWFYTRRGARRHGITTS
ncbi:MAG: CPBP family intramembrane metalloprotease [Pseudomonadota bacterium]|nr:CPBP family intramembrane metalloprotease [Pseudomonadota bacterium]